LHPRAPVLIAGLSVILSLAVVHDTAAVINQISGRVLPVESPPEGETCPGSTNHCMQTGLNYGEGINPPGQPPNLPGPIDAVLDANTGPETFRVPQTGGRFNTVTFRLILEQAGFDNIFGWYNVGDPNKRYPAIFSCRDGQRGLYEGAEIDGDDPPKLSAGFTTTIDFEAEFQAGRYLGKQIAFYLVSPEGSANYDNGASTQSCATDPIDQGTLTSGGPIDDDGFDEADGHDDDNGFGRIYYTESALNNDGNYVHYLIYRSKAEPKNFYFAFEDLFRGGDDDFDDTLVKVEGLVPVCEPEQEVCDGKDNNCNDRIDENLFRPCTSDCGEGQERCEFTDDDNPDNDWVDCDAPQPEREICDGLDNDCDTIPDNNVPLGPLCVVGTCPGQMRCIGGAMRCDAPEPTIEQCDGKDNNCNDQIDENLVRPCFSTCGIGTQTCQFTDDDNPDNDWGKCTAPAAEDEICDGLDNDCDGVVDNDIVGEGLPCDHASGNTCNKGEIRCVGGKMRCIGATTGAKEICDCYDNDCDEQVDEGDICPPGTACVACGCRVPCGDVEFGCPIDYVCDNDFCIPDDCAGVNCSDDARCIDGKCVSLCQGLDCPEGKVCDKGRCVEDNCYGLGCDKGQVCIKQVCVTDPCLNVSCDEGFFCADGRCKRSCGDMTCSPTQSCREGECVEDPCLFVSCPAGVRCVNGSCDETCLGASCGVGRICSEGTCIDDPCTTVTCYGDGEICRDGQCVLARFAAATRTDILVTGGGGCSCRTGPVGADPPWWLLIALLPIVRRRRSR